MIASIELVERLDVNQVKQIARSAVENPKIVGTLLAFLSDKDIQVVKNAAWILGNEGVLSDDMVQKHIGILIQHLENPAHPGVQRNILRALQKAAIPEAHQGVLFGLCYDFIINPQIPIAIRAFSMTVCANISRQYPELQAELQTTLEDLYEHGSAGIKSRIKHTLKQNC